MSVGHAQRAIEAGGIPTVSVYVKSFEHVARLMRVSRAIVTRHPMGRPLGAPGDVGRQLAVVTAALDLLATASEPTIVELPASYRAAPR